MCEWNWFWRDIANIYLTLQRYSIVYHVINYFIIISWKVRSDTLTYLLILWLLWCKTLKMIIYVLMQIKKCNKKDMCYTKMQV